MQYITDLIIVISDAFGPMHLVARILRELETHLSDKTDHIPKLDEGKRNFQAVTFITVSSVEADDEFEDWLINDWKANWEQKLKASIDVYFKGRKPFEQR